MKDLLRKLNIPDTLSSTELYKRLVRENVEYLERIDRCSDDARKKELIDTQKEIERVIGDISSGISAAPKPKPAPSPAAPAVSNNPPRPVSRPAVRAVPSAPNPASSPTAALMERAVTYMNNGEYKDALFLLKTLVKTKHIEAIRLSALCSQKLGDTLQFERFLFMLAELDDPDGLMYMAGKAKTDAERLKWAHPAAQQGNKDAIEVCYKLLYNAGNHVEAYEICRLGINLLSGAARNDMLNNTEKTLAAIKREKSDRGMEKFCRLKYHDCKTPDEMALLDKLLTEYSKKRNNRKFSIFVSFFRVIPFLLVAVLAIGYIMFSNSLNPYVSGMRAVVRAETDASFVLIPPVVYIYPVHKLDLTANNLREYRIPWYIREANLQSSGLKKLTVPRTLERLTIKESGSLEELDLSRATDLKYIYLSGLHGLKELVLPVAQTVEIENCENLSLVSIPENNTIFAEKLLANLPNITIQTY